MLPKAGATPPVHAHPDRVHDVKPVVVVRECEQPKTRRTRTQRHRWTSLLSATPEPESVCGVSIALIPRKSPRLAEKPE
jgi:hypothetical protein